MVFMRKSRRRRFFVHCPLCGNFLEKSEEEETEERCDKCKAKLDVRLKQGALFIGFDSKLLRSPEYDGDPAHDRRLQVPATF